MFDSKLFRRAFLLLLVIIFLDYLAEVFYFHWTLWWYDVVLHFLSGGCAALAFMHFYFGYFKFSKISKIKAVKYSFFFVFIVGVAWEIFELWHGDTSFSDGIFYVRDTLSDIIIDLCGGFFATIYSFKFFPNIDDTIKR